MTNLDSSDHVVVVGAGLAGWRLVEALRRDGYAGALSLIGDETEPPYDRPPLSKQVLAGKWDLAKATLATPEHLEAARARTYFGTPARRLDVAGAGVELADGRVIQGTRVVIATGSRARPLRYPSSGVLTTLRSARDLRRLLTTIASLDEGSVVAVIGGGFVGAEVATSLRARGLTPVVLEVAARPLLGVLGDDVSSWLVSLPGDAGIELRTDQLIRDVRPDANAWSVEFDDGTSLAAAAVVAAVGSTLDLAWLEDSGLTLDNGVVVDRDLQCAHGVAAIGDVARFLLGRNYTEPVRVEHWQVATDHAAQLARYWTHGERPSAPMIPYFWSDQYAKKIQMLGHPSPRDDVLMVSGSVAERKWLALYTNGREITGIVALSQPRGLMLAKPVLDTPTTLDAALELAPWSS